MHLDMMKNSDYHAQSKHNGHAQQNGGAMHKWEVVTGGGTLLGSP